MNSLPKTTPDLRAVHDDYVARFGNKKAIAQIAADHGVTPATVRRRLADAGLRAIRSIPPMPPLAEMAAALEDAVGHSGERASVTVLAVSYGVTTVTIRKWLSDLGLRSMTRRVPPRPITEPCPCGAVATTRYKGEDPARCFRCYMRTYAADVDSKFHRSAREYIAEVKKTAVCHDCGEKYPPCVFHFDHVPGRGPKLFNIGNGDYAVETVKAEIAKCDIVCANCHAIRTWITRGKSLDEAV